MHCMANTAIPKSESYVDVLGYGLAVISSCFEAFQDGP